MKITRYSMDIKPNTKIAVVSDLHDMPYKEAIEALKQISPDIIFAVGDIFERAYLQPRDENQKNRCMHKAAYGINALVEKIHPKREAADRQNGYNFFEEISHFSPVVYSKGNHDMVLAPEDIEFLNKFSKSIMVLDDSDEYIKTKNGKILHIGCVSNIDSLWFEKYLERTGRDEKGNKQNSNEILLCHQPENLIGIEDKIKHLKLVVCGHTHGGQWKIFGKGLYAPSQGLFPKYDSGWFGNIIVSAGAANTSALPRLGNPPEVVQIDVRL